MYPNTLDPISKTWQWLLAMGSVLFLLNVQNPNVFSCLMPSLNKFNQLLVQDTLVKQLNCYLGNPFSHRHHLHHSTNSQQIGMPLHSFFWMLFPDKEREGCFPISSGKKSVFVIRKVILD